MSLIMNSPGPRLGKSMSNVNRRFGPLRRGNRCASRARRRGAAIARAGAPPTRTLASVSSGNVSRPWSNGSVLRTRSPDSGPRTSTSKRRPGGITNERLPTARRSELPSCATTVSRSLAPLLASTSATLYQTADEMLASRHSCVSRGRMPMTGSTRPLMVRCVPFAQSWSSEICQLTDSGDSTCTSFKASARVRTCRRRRGSSVRESPISSRPARPR